MLVGAGVEVILDQAQLAFAADKWRFETLGFLCAADHRDHAQRPPEPDRLGLSLQGSLPEILVDERGLGGPSGGITDQHRPRLGLGLDPRRRVDQVPSHHPLGVVSKGDRGVACQHPGPSLQRGLPDLDFERRHSLDQIESSPHRPLGVVLVSHRGTPHGHHRVADEFLNDAAVEAHHRTTGVEVAGEQFPHLLGVSLLREHRESDQVGEEHGDKPALRGGSTVSDWRRRDQRLPPPGCRPTGQRCPAFAAEARIHINRLCTLRAYAAKLGTALFAELAARTVVRPTVRTRHSRPPDVSTGRTAYPGALAHANRSSHQTPARSRMSHSIAAVTGTDAPDSRSTMLSSCVSDRHGS